MFKLILDVGNTQIKIILFENDTIKKISYIKTNFTNKQEKLFISKITEIKKEYLIKKIIIGSVVNNLNSIILEILNKIFCGTLICLIEPNDFIPYLKFHISLPHAAVGVDILACALWASHKQKDTLIINFGSAIFAILLLDFKLKGVMILPGTQLMLYALSQKLSQIDLQNWSYDYSWGCNTETAINSGIYYAIRGFVREITLKTKVEWKIDNVIFGSGRLLKKEDLKIVTNDLNYVSVPHLTAHGLWLLNELMEEKK